MSFGSRSLPPPTKDEAERMDAIKRANWCVACLSFEPVELHHILSEGGLRLGHLYTVGLCRPCHAEVKTRHFKALHTNQAMLDASNYVVGWRMTTIPPSRARRGSTDRPVKRHQPPSKTSKRGTRCTASAKTYPRNPSRLA